MGTGGERLHTLEQHWDATPVKNNLEKECAGLALPGVTVSPSPGSCSVVWCGNTSSGTGAVRESLARAWLGSVSPYSPSRTILRVLGWTSAPPTAPRGVSAPNPALLGAFLGQ